MAIGLVMQFKGGVGSDTYDAVMKHMGLDRADATWPQGLISHVAGATEGGWCVVDIWQSKADADAFLANRLGPAFGAVGGLPEPQVTPFQVHNSYKHG